MIRYYHSFKIAPYLCYVKNFLLNGIRVRLNFIFFNYRLKLNTSTPLSMTYARCQSERSRRLKIGIYKHILIKFKQALILFALSILYFRIHAQQFNFKNYSLEEGLAQSQVFAMIQDHYGQLWLGTRGGGINCFDGIHFKTYTTKDGLINNYIYSLYQDKKNNIWIGTNNGLSCYNGTRFTNYFLEKDTLNIAVYAIIEDDQNKLWIATDKGLYYFNGNNFQNYSAEKNFYQKNIYCLFIDKKKNLWIGGDKGLGKVEPNGTTRIFGRKDGLNNLSIRSICEDTKGTIWVGTYGNGFLVYNDTSFISIDKKGEFSKQIITHIINDSKNEIWLATVGNGVYRFNRTDSSFTNLKESDGLSNNHVRLVLEDSWGNYWFGTSGGGISKYFGQQFNYYTKNNGLSGNFIYSLFEDSKNRLWIGTSDKGLCYYDGNNFITINNDSNTISGRVKAIAETKDSLICFGIDGVGCYLYNGITLRSIQALEGKYFKDIKRDADGTLWIATLGAGLYKLIPDENYNYEVKRFYYSKNNVHNRINCLLIDSLQRIWIGYENNGVACLSNDSISKHIKKKQGLSSDAIRSLAMDHSGFLWIGTAGGGINRMNLYADSVQINVYDSLSSNNIYLLQFDKEDNLFAGYENGIDKLTLNKDRHIIELKHYGKLEGFLGIETCQNASCLDHNGNLWFGTINGLNKFNPNTIVHNAKAPALKITEIQLNYEPLEKTRYATIDFWNCIKDTLRLHYYENKISIGFSAINLSNPENVKYSWKLESFDDQWSPPTSQNSIFYSNLLPGDYIFCVKTCNEDNVWSTEQKIYFSILPPFWNAWWFIILVSFCGLAFIILIYKWRVSRIKKKNEAIRKNLEMEKNIVELEQKALRLQMNPHFIFNALNSIQSLISQKDEKTARYYLAKFSKLMRMILENSRNTTISLEDEIESLKMYITLEQFCTGNAFDFQIVIQNNLDVKEIRIPPMLIQPFIENAIIHGIRSLEQKGMINISFSINNEILECKIEDNGIGRKKAAEIKSRNEQQHKSTALLVTRERLTIFSSQGSKTPLEIIDLTNKDGNAGGTLVILRIPINLYAFQN